MVANVFVLGQRFDHATFDPLDAVPTRGSVDEEGKVATLDQIADSRATTGMFGAGYLEMLAREITFDLRAQALSLAPGGSVELASKGISFGTLRREVDGTWDTSGLEGLPGPSLGRPQPRAPEHARAPERGGLLRRQRQLPDQAPW